MAVKNLLLLALLGVLLVTVQGQEEKKPAEEKGATEEKKSEEEEEEEDDERKLTVKNEKTKVTIKSDKKEGNVETEFKFVFSVKGFPNVRLTEEVETENKETESDFRVGLMKIVELEENTFDTPFNSSKVTKLTGKSSEWSEIQYTNETKNGASVLTFTTERRFQNGMIVAWETIVTNTKTNISSEVKLSPKAVKFSVKITNYQYLSDATNVKLALVGQAFSRVETEVETPETETPENEAEDDLKDDDDEIEMGSKGSFTWDNWVLVNGTKNSTLTPKRAQPKNTTKDSDEEEDDNAISGEKGSLMAWIVSENKPTSIYWDPILTSEKSSANMAGFSVLLLTIAALVSLF